MFPGVDRSPELEYKSVAMQFRKSLILLLLACLMGAPGPAEAIVEIGRVGDELLVIEDVYQREGTSFVAIEDVLKALQMRGDWDSVAHVFRIRTAHGLAVISPGSQFLKLGENFVPIAHRPRFIDSKLRVSEEFILGQLAPLLDQPLQYRNHNPTAPEAPEDPLDRLFAFLLRKQPRTDDRSQWTVALDPAHGGTDTGVIASDGSKEKTITLAVAERIERLLKMNQEAPVLMTRDGDYAVDGGQRLQAVAAAEADVLLSLHAQNFFSPEAHGVMLFVQAETVRDLPETPAGGSASRMLAERLEEALAAGGFTVMGVAERPLLPLGRGDLPRVLVEMGYMSNRDGLAMLKNPTRQQDLARALFDGLQAYYQDSKDAANDFASPDPQR